MKGKSLIFIGVLLATNALAHPQPRGEVLELFSSLDRPVATVGESLIMTVEVVASPRDRAEGEALKHAFESLQLDLPVRDIELVRSYKTFERLSNLDLYGPDRPPSKVSVLHLRKRFVIRPKRDGVLEIPGPSTSFRGRTFSAPYHELNAYRIEGDLVSTQRAVLPLVVESSYDGIERRRFQSTGSAFLVAEDALVTAYHVVVNARRITATLPNGRNVRIKKAWSIDPSRDIAVLFIDPKEVRRAGMSPLPIAPRKSVSLSRSSGDTDRVVFTAGWPDGLQRIEAGVLFRSNQHFDDDAIWISSNKVRPGDSGGPLLDRLGRVIGVVSYGMSAGAERIQMLENVSTATDPRPALSARRLMRRPSGLGVFRAERFFDRHPQARVIKVMSLLSEFKHVRRRSDPELIDIFLGELNAAVEQSFGAPRLHFLKGSAYQMLGEFDQATNAYQHVLVKKAEHYPAAYSLAYCHLALRSYAAAADLFNFTTRFEPYLDLAEYGLAQAEMQLLEYDEAILHLQRIIHRHGDFAPAVYLLGRAYIGKGDDQAAARILVKLKELSPGWGELLRRSIRLLPFRPVTRLELEKATIRRIE